MSGTAVSIDLGGGKRPRAGSPSAPAGDVPGPIPPPPAAALFPDGNIPPTTPGEDDPEALAILVQARGGDEIEAELVGAIEFIDARTREAHRSVAAGGEPGPAVRAIAALSARRARYAARLAAVRALLGRPADPPADAPTGELVAWLEGDGATMNDRIAAAKAGAAQELADVEARIAALVATAGDPDRYLGATTPAGDRGGDLARRTKAALRELSSLQTSDAMGWQRAWVDVRDLPAPRFRYAARGAQDNLLEQLGDLVTRRRAIRGRVERLGLAAGALRAIATRATAAAIESAGGASKVIEGAISASLLSRMPEELAGEVAAVAEAEAAHRGCGEALDKLATAGIGGGEGFTKLEADRVGAMARVVSARTELAARHRELWTGAVDRAIAGDESSRARLEAVARSRPDCFARGLAEALASARADRAALAELAASIGD